MKKARPAFNVELQVDDTLSGSHSLPYTGEFTVLSDGRLVRCFTKGLETHKGLVDLASTPPLHVDFEDRPEAYLVRRGSDYYLKDRALEVTAEVVRATVDAAKRYRT